MNKLILYVFAFFSLMSCSNDIEGEDEPEITPVYQLTDIQYSLEEGDGETEEWISLPEFRFVNQTSLSQTVTIPTMKEVNETSCFSSDDKNAFPLAKTDSIWIKIPESISDNNVLNISGQTRLYVTGETVQSSPLNTDRIITVLPNHLLVSSLKVRFRVLLVTYTATFEDKVSGQQYKTKGKWKGSLCAGSNCHSALSEIKQ